MTFLLLRISIPIFVLTNYNSAMLKDIEKILKSQKKFLKKEYRVKKIGVFGSFARGEQTKTSDIDILVEFYEPIGWEFFDLQEYLRSVLKREIDLVTKNALKPQIRTVILKELIYA